MFSSGAIHAAEGAASLQGRTDTQEDAMDYEELKQKIAELPPETMTQAERGQKYAAGEVVDHIPFSLQSNEEAMTDIFGYTTAQSLDGTEVMIDVLKRRKEEFGIEGIKVGLRLRTVGQAVGSTMHFPEVGIDSVEKFVLDQPDFSGLDEILKNDPYTNPLYQSMLQRCRELKDAFPDMGVNTVVAGPITTAAAIRPIELVLRDTMKHRDKLSDLLNFCVDHSLAWVDMMVKEFGSMPCGICDPVSCADIFSPRQYEQYSEPYLTRLIDGLYEITGRKPGLHICGKTHPLWSHMLNLNIASYSVDNSEDLEKAKEILGNKYMLVGNVAPVDVMLNGTIDEVIDTCRECLRKGADSPMGYTLGTGCQVPIGTKRENFDAFIYAARKYGRGAQKGSLPQGLED